MKLSKNFKKKNFCSRFWGNKIFSELQNLGISRDWQSYRVFFSKKWFEKIVSDILPILPNDDDIKMKNQNGLLQKMKSFFQFITNSVVTNSSFDNHSSDNN